MKRLILLLLLMLEQVTLFAQASLQSEIKNWVITLQPIYKQVGNIHLDKIHPLPKSARVEIYLNGASSYYLYHEDFVDELYREADSIIKKYYPSCKPVIYADKKEIGMLIPNYYRRNRDIDIKRFPSKRRILVPIVKNMSQPYDVEKGLSGRNIALWSSHGLYYDQKEDRWKWQRSKLFGTVEDKLTLDYVLNYITPMLENAGATVFMPQERDSQIEEIIVDNDVQSATSSYEESNNRWTFTSIPGWGGNKIVYKDGDNPFEMGTCRQTNSQHEPSTSIQWSPFIEKTGDYAVYVSYQSLKDGVSDARYTVCHAGGKTIFFVNQKQGGGTWIYLGTFSFKESARPDECSVILTNESSEEGKIVTADAVRFGGGFGNIGRTPALETKVHEYNATNSRKVELSVYANKTYESISECPRYLEASRYWLQWAGFPINIYSKTGGVDDYLDDIFSRGMWVNYLNNGSINAPDSIGLAIPIDLTLGLHTDAGIKGGDSIVGSLGICLTKEKGGNFSNGQSRRASRDFSDMVLTELCQTINRCYNTSWNIRGVWDKSYVEARLPQTPTMLLELLSHQNISDVCYAVDPSFQFLASRAIYKAIARFIAYQNSQECIIAPLPIDNFCTKLIENDSVLLEWSPTVDSLENNGALPDAYVVYTRIDDGGFDNGVLVGDTMIKLPIVRGIKYDFKVVAVNEGGASFPSEILSACNMGSHDKILIINGFSGVFAPKVNKTHSGVTYEDWIPYKKSFLYTGEQYDFDTTSQWLNNDFPGWGASASTYEKSIIVGNNFDYVTKHGSAIRNVGISYESCSLKSLKTKNIKIDSYTVVDLMLGKYVGDANEDLRNYLIDALKDYLDKGGAFFVSGTNASAFFNGDRNFVRHYLKAQMSIVNSINGFVEYVYSPQLMNRNAFLYATTPNNCTFAVKEVGGIIPQESALPLLRYKESGICAASTYSGENRIIVMGFPFEIINDDFQRNTLGATIFNFLIKK